MKPATVVMLLLLSVAGCAIPEPIPFADQNPVSPQADKGLKLGMDGGGPRDMSIHADHPTIVLDGTGGSDAGPSAADGGWKVDGLKLDGVRFDGLKTDGKKPDGGKKDASSKKDAVSKDAKPKG